MSRPANTRLVLLGTSGGPLPSPVRAGIAQAVVVGGRAYLVDCGYGATQQLRRARLLTSLAGVFLTHLHSDHDCDYFNLFLLGWPLLQHMPPIPVYGPGTAGGLGSLPPDEPDAAPFPVVSARDPTPGLIETTAHQFRAHAYDINARIRDSGRCDPRELVAPREIEVPAALPARGPDRVAPPMDPITVMENEDVRVTAVLVHHPPVFPAFAYRFDTADGSIVISGDTTPSANLVSLARGADILVHEVYTDEFASGHDDDPPSRESQRRRHHLLSSHTPLSQVGAVAAQAGAATLVLTHFIPGDDALPEGHWTAGAGAGFGGQVVVGHDLLDVTV